MQTSSDPIGQVISCIERAMEAGRPIVPLFGAGVSVDAGIPTTPVIVDHLAQLTHYYERRSKDFWPSCREYLLANGWPGMHQLNLDLLLELESEHPTRVAIEDKLSSETTRINYEAMLLEHPFRPLFTKFLRNAGKHSLAAGS